MPSAFARRHLWKYALALLLVGVFIFWAVSRSHLSLRTIWDVVTRFSALSLGLAFLACMLQWLCWVGRMSALFPPDYRISRWKVASAIFYGQLTNTFVPARAGDALKVVLLAKGQPDLKQASLTATGVVLADKIIDMLGFALAILFSGALWLPELHLKSYFSHSIPFSAIGIAVAILAVAFFLLRRWMERLRYWWRHFLAGLQGLLRPGPVFLSTTFAILVWLCEAMAIRVLTAAQGYPLGMAQAVYVLVVLNLAIAIPISVASIGAFEAAIVLALTTFHLPLATAIAIALAHHFMQMVSILAWSVVCAVSDRMRRPAVSLPPAA